MTIHKADQTLSFSSFLFPGGEVGVKLDATNLRYKTTVALYQTIIARLQSPKDIVELMMITDALRQFDPTPIRLFLPYIPYARQDRVCVPGESFSLKVFANLINGLSFERVTVVDPHSDVTGAVFERLTTITQFDVINRFEAFSKAVMSGPTVFVSPDAGANKKTSVLAGYFNHSEFIRADKLRDLTNGNIKETVVYAEDLSGRTVVIADDLGDGCRTFIELAKVLNAKGAAKIILYVTHGLFSKGTKVVFEGGIDEIYTTDSFTEAVNGSEGLTILRLEDAFPI